MTSVAYSASTLVDRYTVPKKGAKRFEKIAAAQHGCGPFELQIVGQKPQGFGLRETSPPQFHGIFLHGGPGSRIPQGTACSFDIYRGAVWVPEQRRIHAVPLAENTTNHLMEDIHQFMERYHIPQAVFYGSSWGATLALAFAVKYPHKVKAVLGTCLVTEQSGPWAVSEACGHQSPLHAAHYVPLMQALSTEERGDVIAALYRRFQAAYAYMQAEGEAAFLASPHAAIVQLWTLYMVTLDDSRPRDLSAEIAKVGPDLAYQCARGLLQLHYLNHRFFLNHHAWLRELSDKVARRIPVQLLYGAHDVVTHQRLSADVAQACGAEVVEIPTASHNYDAYFVHEIVTRLATFTT
ncbi:MAG: alpha/beta fold hydrolase [Alphaproteobacteria bacterium]